MARVSTYLNFARSTEEAFTFYKSVFGTEFAQPIARFKDVPPSPDMPPLPEADKNLVMHVALPILGGHVLMGTDSPESMGPLTTGQHVYDQPRARHPQGRRSPLRRARRRRQEGDAAAGDVLGRLLGDGRGSLRRPLDGELREQDLASRSAAGSRRHGDDGKTPWSQIV